MAAHLWDIPPGQQENYQESREPEELSVFGYACKLFRDDHKALSIDRGEQLIPWMGDSTLMIDRYDGRGHLYDLSKYDSSHVKTVELSEDEKHIEQLCDEERYLELKHDLAEKQMYEDEEWKRYYQSLSEGFNAVGFSYDHQHYQDYIQTAEAAEPEPVFKVPEELQVPTDMAVPETEKQNAIIEKTAKFIAGHGAQMEIIIKTKQAKNEQFNFLHFEDPLNQYYKHMVNMIKTGKYKPKCAKEEETENKEEDDHGQHGYLHPSLMKPAQSMTTPAPNLAPAVKMPAVAIHDTPYGKLLKHLKKSVPDSDRSRNNSPRPDQDSGCNSPVPNSSTPPPESTAGFIQQSTDYHHMHPGVPPPPGLEPVTLPVSNQPPPPGTEVEGPLLPPHLQQQVLQQEEEEELKPPSIKNTPMMGPSLEPKIVPPPPDIQPIIDRMAKYVAKNGVEFEIVVRSKNDPRFEFLQPWHQYFRYYNSKKKIYIEEVLKEREQQEKDKPAKLSFSIKNKTKDQDGVVTSEKKVFDHDSSGEEDSEGTRERRSDISGTSTPVDGEFGKFSYEDRSSGNSAVSEKKIAEEKLKDKLAQAARDKLSKASREKQIQAERKRKAAMFINMLKSAKSTDKEDSKNESTQSSSRANTPASFDGDRESRRSASRSRTQFSRSRSRSPRRRKRSRSPKRPVSPPPASAYLERSESRSPSRFKSIRQTSPYRRRSRSPSLRKRSRSPSLRKTDSPPRSSKKSKKKKRSKSRSPSKKSKSSKSERRREDTSVDYSSIEMERIKERLSASSQPFSTSSSTDISTKDRFRISQPVDEDSNSAISSDSGSKNVSNYMLNRVRALIKASREAVKKEEDIFDDS